MLRLDEDGMGRRLSILSGIACHSWVESFLSDMNKDDKGSMVSPVLSRAWGQRRTSMCICEGVSDFPLCWKTSSRAFVVEYQTFALNSLPFCLCSCSQTPAKKGTKQAGTHFLCPFFPSPLWWLVSKCVFRGGSKYPPLMVTVCSQGYPVICDPTLLLLKPRSAHPGERSL